MSVTNKKTLVGTGKVYLDGRFLDNNAEFAISFDFNETTMPDYTSPGGGVYDTIKRVNNMTVGLKLMDFNSDNLAMVLYGSATAVAAAAVTDESITTGANLDRLVKTAHMIDTDETVTVTSDPAGTTYVEDTDYTISPAGIVVLSTGSMAASTGYLIDYTKKAVDLIQMLTGSGEEFSLIFDGWNEAEDEPFYCELYKFKPGGADGLGLITEGSEFGEMPITGTVIKDTTVTGAGLSKYGKFSLPSA